VGRDAEYLARHIAARTDLPVAVGADAAAI
jgi:hypothetical protein